MPTATVRHPIKSKRVGVAQIAPVLGDVDANLSAHVAAVDRARAEKIDLLVFPELSLTGYRLKDTVPGIAAVRSGKQIQELSKLSEEISFVVGLVEEDARHNFYNSAFLFESGHVQAVHRKAYLPTYGMFDEQRYFARGRSISAFHCKIGRAAILICEDMLHPTAVTVAGLDGASTIIVPSASPVKGVTGVETGEGGGRLDANGRHWEGYNRAIARTLGLYIVYANRVGVEDGIAFWGGSEIIDPGGETVAKAAYYEEDFIGGQISEDAVRRRRMQAPVLRDENMDLTINELSRLADRRPPVDRSRSGDRDRRPDDRRPREGSYGDRRPRGRSYDDRRPRERSDGPRSREDRRDSGGGAHARDDRRYRDRDRDRGPSGQGRGDYRPRERREQERGRPDRGRGEGRGGERGGDDRRRPRDRRSGAEAGAHIERGRLREALADADKRRGDGATDRERGDDKAAKHEASARHEAVHAKRAVDIDMAVADPSVVDQGGKDRPAPAKSAPSESVAGADKDKAGGEVAAKESN